MKLTNTSSWTPFGVGSACVGDKSKVPALHKKNGENENDGIVGIIIHKRGRLFLSRRRRSLRRAGVLIRSVLLLISFTVQVQMSSEIPDGRPFLKRSEYNSIGFGLYNVDSKTDIEKLFFGDFNAMVEFFILPSFEHHEGAYGFRVFRDSLQHCIIESKYITNWRAVISAVSTKFPTRSVHPDEKLTEEKKNEIWEYNRKMRDMQQKESLRLYEIASQSFPVNNLFAEKLHEIVVVAIDNFVGKGEPAVIKDGYKATFRCVVADEVWTLTVRQPKDQIKRLSDLCIQLIENMKTNQMDESNYIELFKNVMQ